MRMFLVNQLIISVFFSSYLFQKQPYSHNSAGFPKPLPDEASNGGMRKVEFNTGYICLNCDTNWSGNMLLLKFRIIDYLLKKITSSICCAFKPLWESPVSIKPADPRQVCRKKKTLSHLYVTSCCLHINVCKQVHFHLLVEFSIYVCAPPSTLHHDRIPSTPAENDTRVKA